MIPHQHNLLGHEFLPAVRRRKAIFKAVWGALLILFMLTAAVGAVLVVPSLAAARVLYVNARAGRDDLQRAKDAADQLDFSKASAALSDGVTHFETAHDALNRLGVVARLPVVSDNVDALRNLLDGGRNAAYALREAVDVGADIMSVMKSGIGSAATAMPGLRQEQRSVSRLSRDERRALLQKMMEAPDHLGLARDALDQAIASFDRVPDTSFTHGLLTALQPQKQKLIELRGYLSQDLSLLSQIPPMIGYPEPKTYLFLLLNNTELRPGGGFIGVYGIVKISDGSIDSFFTDDSYSLDGPAEGKIHEAAPAPLRQYLRSPDWFMRDANWSPDFAVSAMLVEHFYHLEGGKEANLDGVIGLTPTVISRILAVTGPVTIDGATFTADNVTDELEYQVERGFAAGGVPYAQRKDIVGKLGKTLIDRLLGLPVSRLADLAKIAGDTIAERQLMFYFEDPSLQAAAEMRDWAGRMRAAPGDSLAVVDANLASLKTDPAVRRTISYSFRPDGDSWIARAQVTYKHAGTFNWKTTRYRTYTRFYVPPGSTLLKGEGMMKDDKLNDPARAPGTIDVGEDLGRTVFGGFISIEPGETRTLAVEYRLSDDVTRLIRSGHYRLDVRKELGTAGPQLTLDLDFGKNLVRAAPPEEPKEWGDTRYRLSTDLRIDRQFSVDLAN